MSRRALWPAPAPAVGDSSVGGLAGREVDAAPTAPPVAPSAMLPVRSGAALPSGSAVDVHVALVRLASLFSEAAGILRDLSEVQLESVRDPRLMSSVETTTTRARLMSVHDVAQRLQLDERTVRRMRARGELPPALDLGSVLRWAEPDFEAWLEGRRER